MTIVDLEKRREMLNSINEQHKRQALLDVCDELRSRIERGEVKAYAATIIEDDGGIALNLAAPDDCLLEMVGAMHGATNYVFQQFLE